MSKELSDVKKLTKEEIFPVQDIHHVEIYTGNAKQAAYYYCRAFGFNVKAYRGLKQDVGIAYHTLLSRERFASC